jgi:hypothetical protein
MLGPGERRRLAPRVWALLQAEIEAHGGGRLGADWFLRGLQRQFEPDDVERVGGAVVRVLAGALAAEVTLHRQERPVAVEGVERRGTTPFIASQLDHGSWVAMVHREGRLIRLPFVTQPLRPVQLEVRWPRPLPPAFTFVSSGGFLYGGDPTADGGRPPRVAHLRDYAIADHRVTAGEYQRFLEASPPEVCQTRWPKTPSGAPRWAPDPQVAPRPDDAAVGVTLADAYAYVQWRGQRDGIPYRLPTSAQWEKAARGVDGRLWPGGASGTADLSPYGIVGLASGGLEWTLTAARDQAGVCYVRGRGAQAGLHLSPCTARLPMNPHAVDPELGFRLVIPEAWLHDGAPRPSPSV